MRDLALATRMLWKAPGITVVAVMSLGLGVALNTTLYSIVDVVLLEPPSARAIEQLVAIESGRSNLVSFRNAADVVAETSALTSMALHAPTLLNLGEPEALGRAHGLLVSDDYFRVVGVAVAFGTVLTEDDTIVLSHRFWQRRLNADAAIVGRELRLNGNPYVVAGVLPETHRSIMGWEEPELYLLARPYLGAALEDRAEDRFWFTARMNPGTTREQARAAIAEGYARLERRHPDVNEGLSRGVEVYGIGGLGALRSSAADVVVVPAVLATLFSLVLLIACANVSGLLLARASNRGREVAIRTALGARRWHIVRMLLAESVFLSILAGGAGLLTTLWLISFLEQVRLPGMPLSSDLGIRPDLGMVGVGALLALVAAALSGLVPAIYGSRTRLAGALQQGGSVTPPGRVRGFLVVGQVATAMVLLAVSALFARSLTHITTIDPGFDPGPLAIADVDTASVGRDEASARVFLADVIKRVGALPGVDAVSVAEWVPLRRNSSSGSLVVQGRTVERAPTAFLTRVGSGYFATMGTPVVRGREFDDRDRPDGEAVAVVSETLVRSTFGTDEALGELIRFAGDTDARYRRIVGIVRDSKYEYLGEAPRALVYFPLDQEFQTRHSIIARTTGDPEDLLPGVRSALSQLDPALLVETNAMTTLMETAFLPYRIGAGLLGAVGIAGLLLAMIGLYGVIAAAVASRRREIGIRLALGASRQSVRGMLARYGIALVAAGATAGALVAAFFAPALRFLLAGVSPVDPLSYLGAAVVLMVFGALASLLPTRSAVRIAPADTLSRD